MFKLVILIEPPPNQDYFDDQWPAFLHSAEQMPGLLRETTSRTAQMVFGDNRS